MAETDEFMTVAEVAALKLNQQTVRNSIDGFLPEMPGGYTVFTKARRPSSPRALGSGQVNGSGSGQ